MRIAATGPGLLAPPQPARRPAFALTPLADIMFQLLIFFMLSTSLAPYAVLSLGGPAPAAAAPAPPPAAAAVGGATVWHLGRGTVRAGTDRIPLSKLPAALAALAGQGVEEVLLFVTDTASLQDLVTVLEVAQAGGLPRLRLMGR